MDELARYDEGSILALPKNATPGMNVDHRMGEV
jgi:hypothetical protein